MDEVLKINIMNNKFNIVNQFKAGETFSVFLDPIETRTEHAKPFMVIENAVVQYVFTKNLD